MAYNVGFYTTCSPFFSSKLALWRHHDAIFKKLSDEHDVKFTVIMPVTGGSSFVERLYNRGDRNVLYPTLREINFDFPAGFLTDEQIDNLDALYLDSVHTYQVNEKDVSAHLRPSADEQAKFVRKIMRRMVEQNKPILFSDVDGFTEYILEDGKADFMELYEEFKDYPKLKIFSPFQREGLKNFTLIPFEVDPELYQPIRPYSEREFLLRYVGNNYYRANFVPIFEKLSYIGKTQVNGAGWNRIKEASTAPVIWGPKIPMTPDGVINTYNNSKIGLAGKVFVGGEIWLYRWKEYLTAGVMIVHEPLPLCSACMPPGSLTTDDLLNKPQQELADFFLNMTDKQYEEIVTEQRRTLGDYLGVDRWVPVMRELLEIK